MSKPVPLSNIVVITNGLPFGKTKVYPEANAFSQPRRTHEKTIIQGMQFQSINEIGKHLIVQLYEEYAGVLFAIFMDCEGFVIAESAGFSVYYPLEVIKRCRELDATHVIVAHQDPQGRIEPLLEDIMLTWGKDLVEAADQIRICLQDIIIVGCGQYFSFHEEGLLIDPPEATRVLWSD